MPNATATEIQQLYLAYFGRPADSGLDYWVSKGIKTKEFAENMYLQNEFISINGQLSIQEQVNNMYQNLFARDADTDGLNYWTKQIQTGKLVLASIAVDLIWAATNNMGSEVDKACLSHRTSAAIDYRADVMASASGRLAYQPESILPWIDGKEFTEAKEYMTALGCDGPIKEFPCITCWPIPDTTDELGNEASIGSFKFANSLAKEFDDTLTDIFIPIDNFF
tara:strand:+ start:68 stop:736 length:669 start_codon:yes stop_codon:yes gene_type:complete